MTRIVISRMMVVVVTVVFTVTSFRGRLVRRGARIGGIIIPHRIHRLTFLCYKEAVEVVTKANSVGQPNRKQYYGQGVGSLRYNFRQYRH